MTSLPTVPDRKINVLYLDPAAATRRYNAMVQADESRTWGHLSASAWLAISDRLQSTGILSCTGQSRTFRTDRARDAHFRAIAAAQRLGTSHLR